MCAVARDLLIVSDDEALVRAVARTHGVGSPATVPSAGAPA